MKNSLSLLALPVLAQQGPADGAGGCSAGTLYTALGCIPFQNTSALTIFILKWAMGLGGGVALIIIVFAGYQITTSGGDPKRLQGGKQLMTAGIGGVVFLIFSVFILRIVGVNILGIF